MSIQVAVECFLDPQAGLMKRDDAIEEWRQGTKIKEQLFLEAGQTLQELYRRVGERHPLLRSAVESGQSLAIQIYSRGHASPRYQTPFLSMVPEAAWGNELCDGDTVIFIQPLPA